MKLTPEQYKELYSKPKWSPVPDISEEDQNKGLLRTTLDSLPTLGMGVGGALGMAGGPMTAIPAAGLGGAGGEALKQLGYDALGEGKPGSSYDRAVDISKAGLLSAANETPGHGLGLMMGSIKELPSWLKVLQGGAESEGKITPSETNLINKYQDELDPFSQKRRNQMLEKDSQLRKSSDVKSDQEPITSDSHLESIRARLGGDQNYDVEKAITNAKSANNTYHFDPKVAPIPIPNYEFKGNVLGPNRVMDAAHDDPFKWMDSKYGASKQWLENSKGPVTVNTSSDLIARDDYLKAIPEGSKVNIRLGTDNDQINKLIYPGNPSNQRLQNAYERLDKAGVNVKLINPSKQDIIDSIKAKSGNNTPDQYFQMKTGKTLDQLIGDGDINVRPDLKVTPKE